MSGYTYDFTYRVEHAYVAIAVTEVHPDGHGRASSVMSPVAVRVFKGL